MEVYQTNENGIFTGVTFADPDPLDAENWLIPWGCVQTKPPAFGDGYYAQFDGKAWAVFPIPEPEPDPEVELEVEPEPVATNTPAGVTAECDRRLSYPFAFGEKLYDCDSQSLARITGAATLAGFAMVSGAEAGNLRWHGGQTDFSWIAYDNTLTEMDAPTCFAFGQAAANNQSAIIFAAKAIKAMDPIPENYTDNEFWP